jgi:hypothetical protein
VNYYNGSTFDVAYVCSSPAYLDLLYRLSLSSEASRTSPLLRYLRRLNKYLNRLATKDVGTFSELLSSRRVATATRLNLTLIELLSPRPSSLASHERTFKMPSTTLTSDHGWSTLCRTREGSTRPTPPSLLVGVACVTSGKTFTPAWKRPRWAIFRGRMFMPSHTLCTPHRHDYLFPPVAMSTDFFI